MFHKCKSSDEVKNLFRKIAMLFHPDRGGSNELMSLLNEEYESIFQKFKLIEHEYENIKNTKYLPVDDDVLINDEEKLQLFKDIREYAKNKKSFKLSFLESVEEFGSERGYITKAQYNKLLQSYCAFRMYEK